MANDLTIKLSARGERLTAKMLIERFERAIAMLRTLPANKEWEVVKVRMNSPLVAVFRNPTAEPSDIRQRLKDIRSVTKKPVRPSHLSDSAIDKTLEFAEVVGDNGPPLMMSYGRTSVEITSKTRTNFEKIAEVARRRYFEWTTIRGRLYEVTAVLGGIHRFRVENGVTGDHVSCNFPEDRLAEIREFLRCRIEVYGRAKCSESGEIKSIEVKDFRQLTENKVRFSEIPGINITDGKDSVAHVERIRGGY
jgi:hypothetical protein